MTYRMLKSVAVVVACWLFVNHLPDLARYIRMREMSRPGGQPSSSA